MASASRRSAQPTSLSYASAHASQQQPCRRPLPGILKTTPGFFSFPKGSPTTKTLRFQIPSPTPGSLAQLYAQEEAEQDLVLATGEAATRAKTEKSDSSSPPSAEETSYDKFHLRGHKRRRSPSPRRRSSSSASGADSVVPYWMPKEIQHYFLHYPDDGEEGRGAAGAPCTKEVPSALQCIGSEQPPRKDELAGWRRLASQPRSALATLCFIAALALIFVGTTTNVYVGMVHRARGDGRTPVVAGAGAGGADSAGAKKEPLGSKAVPRSMGDYPDALKRRRAETAEPTRRHAVAAFDSKEEREETTGGDAEIEGRSRHDEVGTDAGDDLPRPVTMDYMGTARDVAEIVHEFSSNEDDAHRSPRQMGRASASEAQTSSRRGRPAGSGASRTADPRRTAAIEPSSKNAPGKTSLRAGGITAATAVIGGPSLGDAALPAAVTSSRPSGSAGAIASATSSTATAVPSSTSLLGDGCWARDVAPDLVVSRELRCAERKV
ncbi:uncharacterized protein LOC144102354 isoform X2 [Amblyomma americanum]